MSQYSWNEQNFTVNAEQKNILNRLAVLEAKIVHFEQQMTFFLNRQDIALCAMSRLKDDILTFQFEDQTVKMYLPLATCDIIQTNILQSSSFWEISQLIQCRKYIKPGAVIVDAGANIGNHTVFFAKFCNAKSVISFEPQKSVFAILQKNVELNTCENVRLYNMGLADKICRGQLAYFQQGNVGGTAFAFSDSSGDFSMTALDELNLKHVDFLKIDVEGAQYAMLRGAEDTIRRCSPVIVIELRYSSNPMHPSYEKEYKRPYDLLLSMGYKKKEQIGEDDFIFVK